MNKRLVPTLLRYMSSPSKYCKAKYPKFTAWIGLRVNKNGDANVYCLPTMYGDMEDPDDYVDNISPCCPGKKLTEHFPVEFRPSIWLIKRLFGDDVARDVVNSDDDITLVPILSTERGWKWNRRQLISYIMKYPHEINDGILRFSGCKLLTSDQQMMRRIFGKHFRAVVREINQINEKLDAYITYHVVNATPKRISPNSPLIIAIWNKAFDIPYMEFGIRRKFRTASIDEIPPVPQSTILNISKDGGTHL